MKTDILTYLVLPTSMQNNHQWADGSYDRVTANTTTNPGKWERIKNKQGWPWDIKLYDDQFVYDWITEQDWTSPRDYKKFVQNHTGLDGKTLQDGVKMFPRFIDDNGPVFPSYAIPELSTILTPKAQSTYRIFTNCVWNNKPNDVGIIEHLLYGPIGIDHGGNVGFVPTLIHQYYWDGITEADGEVNYAQLEENWYAKGFGWVRWTLYGERNGEWVQQNQTIHNQLVGCTSVPPVQFPCF